MTAIIGRLLEGKKILTYYPGVTQSRLTCYLVLCPVTVEGCEHIDQRRSYVLITNHQGAFDIFLICSFLGAPIRWAMETDIAKIPLVEVACRAAGFTFVDNSTPETAARSVLRAECCLRNGASMVVFPEGSRTYDGKMIHFKKGAYRTALDQHSPIIPITLSGPFDVSPTRPLNIYRHRVEMVIHPTVSTENISTSHKGIQALAGQTQEITASTPWEECK